MRVSQGCWVKKIQILWNCEITCIVISRVSFSSVVTTCDLVSFLQPAPSPSQHDDHNPTNNEHHPSSEQPWPPTGCATLSSHRRYTTVIMNKKLRTTTAMVNNEHKRQMPKTTNRRGTKTTAHDLHQHTTTVSFHHHLLQPPFYHHPPLPSATTVLPPPTTTMHANNNMALPHHQLEEAQWLMAMTPVVVTVPMILGEQQPLPSHFLTWKAGATLKMATQQLTMDQQQQHMMYMNNRQGWGEHYNPLCPAPFSHQKQEPHCCQRRGNPQWTTTTNDATMLRWAV